MVIGQQPVGLQSCDIIENKLYVKLCRTQKSPKDTSLCISIVIARARNGAGFEPYANNGGTAVAVAGRDYCIIAADSRLSDGYSILSRNVSRVHRLSENTHLATAGCWADTQGLLRLLRVRAF